MAVEFKASMTKAELLKIAAENGVTADDSLTKTAILDALEAHNAAEAAGAGTEPPADGTGGNGPEAAADGAESAQDGAENAGAGEDTPGAENGAESAQKEPEGYDLFIYAGPTLPKGRLRENAVFNGRFSDVISYLADVVKDYPLVEKLIVPVKKYAAFSVKVKTPGNLAHKYYSDIVSTMRGNREV